MNHLEFESFYLSKLGSSAHFTVVRLYPSRGMVRTTPTEHEKMEDHYFRVLPPVSEPEGHGQGRSTEPYWTVCYAADIDLAPKTSKANMPYPDRDTALQILNKMLPPTIVVDSGNGLHVYWMLKSPTREDTKQWWSDQANRLKAKFAEEGFHTDALTQPTLLLRLPGTFNGDHLVSVIHCDENAYYSQSQINSAFFNAAPDASTPPVRPSYGVLEDLDDLDYSSPLTQWVASIAWPDLPEIFGLFGWELVDNEIFDPSCPSAVKNKRQAILNPSGIVKVFDVDFLVNPAVASAIEDHAGSDGSFSLFSLLKTHRVRHPELGEYIDRGRGIKAKLLSEAFPAREPIQTSIVEQDVRLGLDARDFHDTFPVDALPDSMKEYVLTHDHVYRSGLATPAMTALTFMSAAMTRRYEIAGPDASVPASIWFLLVAPSGYGKTPLTRPLLSVFRTFELQHGVEYATANYRFAAVKSEINKQVKKCGDDHEQIFALQRRLKEEQDKIGQYDQIGGPLSNPTFEVLRRSTLSKIGTFFFSEEAVQALDRARLLDGNSTNWGGLFQGYEGTLSSSQVCGQSGDFNRAENLSGYSSLAIWLAAQPVVLDRLSKDFEGVGALYRFLTISVPSDFGWQPGGDPGVATEGVRRFKRVLWLSLRSFKTVDNHPVQVDIDPQFMNLAQEWSNTLIPNHGPIAQYKSKAPMYISKIATVIATTEWFERCLQVIDAEPFSFPLLSGSEADGYVIGFDHRRTISDPAFPELEVTRDHFDRAMRIYEWCMVEHYRQNLDLGLEEEVDRIMQKALEVIAEREAEGNEGVTATSLAYKAFAQRTPEAKVWLEDQAKAGVFTRSPEHRRVFLLAHSARKSS